MTPERFDGDATDFRERFIWVIRNFAGRPTRYKVLEERFGISARKWQNVCNHVQQPSIEMVAAMATVYPFFLSWMVTGSGRTLIQLDPSDPDWFQTLLDTLENAPAAQTDVLNRYADRLTLDHGIETAEEATSATMSEKRIALEQGLGIEAEEPQKVRPKNHGNK
ncbi:hypothetical protein [Rhodoferax sp. WC2427]|uniref:hypothetical protein n=1 Tax=Rhodoferax sp. WC2427 TaxID=3234144 RepID=UPI003466B02F